MDINNIKVCYACANCGIPQEATSTKDGLSRLTYCDKCEEEGEANAARLKQIFETILEKQKEPPAICDNDKCIYKNTSNICKVVGCYQYCEDCYYALGRLGALNGF